MNLNIGIIIKNLRIENNVTQDQLATALGVTPQAISRWESGNGYPDIEALPALADFFSVSTDELLGYKLAQREENIQNIKNEIQRLAEVGTLSERVKYAREAVSLYPSDEKLRLNLAVCLTLTMCEEEPIQDWMQEAETIYLSLLEQCKEDSFKYEILMNLSSLYSRGFQNSDKALMTINQLPPMVYCREFQKSQGVGDGKTDIYIQEEIDKLTDCLGTAIRNLVLHNDLPNDPSTWDKKIAMMETSSKLYEMIYGENLMFYHTRLTFNHWIISTYQISQGKIDDALASLERACEHAMAYDNSYENDHGKNYTSIFTDKLLYPEPGDNFHELKEHSQAFYMLDRMKHRRYDVVREDERFVKMVEMLKETAR